MVSIRRRELPLAWWRVIAMLPFAFGFFFLLSYLAVGVRSFALGFGLLVGAALALGARRYESEFTPPLWVAVAAALLWTAAALAWGVVVIGGPPKYYLSLAVAATTGFELWRYVSRRLEDRRASAEDGP